MPSVFIWLKGYKGSFGIFSVSLPGKFNELTFFLVSSNISSTLALKVLDTVKLVSKSLFWKLNWVSTLMSSSTTDQTLDL